MAADTAAASVRGAPRPIVIGELAIAAVLFGAGLWLFERTRRDTDALSARRPGGVAPLIGLALVLFAIALGFAAVVRLAR